ncbi:MAG: rhamnogalacturonan acetylesterase [Pyrinomonadaceae bacterium]
MISIGRAARVGIFLTFLCVSASAQLTVFLAGDSTLAVKTADRRPETGWGEMLQQYFDPAKVKIENRAQNGRSTRTFIEQGHWQRIVDDLKKDDYVFVQFGHNDSAKDRPDRYTPPEDFKKNLIRFIADVKGKKANIVLMTPVMRRRFDKDGKFVDVHGEYPDIFRTVAKEQKVPLIDMHRKSEAVIVKYGVEGSKALFLQLKPGEHPNFLNGVDDNTHFRPLGAEEMAKLAVAGIREDKLKLAKYLKK